MTVDLYDILGVEPNAGEGEIKRAFRRLAKEYHPDRNPEDPDAEQRFKEALAAFEILSDPDQRRRYDLYGFDGLQSPDKASFRDSAGGPEGGDRPWWAAGTDVGESASEIFGEDPFDFSHFEDIGDFDFSDAFEPEGFGERGGDGNSGVHRLEIDLLDAVRGAEVEFEYGGEARSVEIEPGANSGDRVRIPKGAGASEDPGAAEGELEVELEVAEHPKLRREGLDLEMEVPVTVVEAVRGATIEIPTPWGPVDLRVPAGIDSGTRLRLEGRGVRREAERGDLYAVVEIVTPDEFDGTEEGTLEELEEAYRKDVRGELEL